VKALVQRVERASVRVDGRTVGEIGTGLLVLVGVTHSDTGSDAAALARKVHGLRILRNERSVADIPDAGVLVVSQFTLFADTRKGRRPSFIDAAPPEMAETLVERCAQFLREAGIHVETGRFGAYMQVSLLNDGPVTIVLDSSDRR